MRITTSRLIAPVLFGVCLVSLPVCAPPGDVPRTQAETPAIAPGMARVWLLRDNDPEEAFGTPIIFANGQPIARSEPRAAAYRDLPPGRYRATVCLLKVKLAPGTQTYLEIQWGPSWQEGVAGGYTFYVRTLSQELGKAYYGSMRYVGPART